ncbi:ArnT family glycosyltransferase, partial [Candidatus Altiarchaeota archaeon]
MATEKNNSGRKTLVLFLIILFVGIFLRSWAFATVRFHHLEGDPITYLELADNILKGRGPVVEYVWTYWFRHPTITHPDDWWAAPLYPYTIALVQPLVGNPFYSGKLVSLLFGVLTLPLVYLVGEKFFDKGTGLLAMFLLALTPQHIFNSGVIMREALTGFLVLLFSYFFLQARMDGKRAYWISSGLLGGVMCLSRYTCIPILLAVMLYTLIDYRKNLPWKNILIFLSIVFIILLPWGVYTWNYFGSPFYSNALHKKYVEYWRVAMFEEEPPTFIDYYGDPIEGLTKRGILLKKWLYYAPILFYPPLIVLLFLTGFIYPSRNEKELMYSRYGLSILVFFSIVMLFSAPGIMRAYKYKDVGRFFMPVFVLLIPLAAHILLRIVREKQALLLTAIVI